LIIERTRDARLKAMKREEKKRQSGEKLDEEEQKDIKKTKRGGRLAETTLIP